MVAYYAKLALGHTCGLLGAGICCGRLVGGGTVESVGLGGELVIGESLSGVSIGCCLYF